MPQHAHLFAEVSVVERTLPPWIHHRCNIPHTHPCFDFQHGCFAGKDKNNKKILVDCSDANRAKGEVLTPLPESFKPLVLTDEMDKAWFDLVKNFNPLSDTIRLPQTASYLGGSVASEQTEPPHVRRSSARSLSTLCPPQSREDLQTEGTGL